jgi:prolyl oligopeptidase
VTDDGELLVITQTHGTDPRNRVLLQPLADPQATPVRLFDAFDAEWEFVCKRGSRLWFLTDKDAPRKRVVSVDLAQPAALATVVAEGEAPIQFVSPVGGKLVVGTLEHAASALRVHSLEGADLGPIELPGLGSVALFQGNLDVPEAFFAFTGYATPTEVWTWNARGGPARRAFAPKVPFQPADYVSERHFYRSRDGTRVPLFVTRHKDVALTPDTPTLLYGYGGFDIALTPGFSPGALAWMELGGVYAVACLRGGSEYGREWHAAGTLARKQNVFDDFTAAAEFLITKGWTRPAKLAIHGRSNGGLLVGACMTQRPELFGAALPGVGVLDMLRYHEFTIGWAWSSDYGRADDPAAFRWLYAYSPLHALRPGTRYPATLITTGQHDDRVVPAHSFKFAAELQRCQAAEAPCLIRVETRGGHGLGKPTALQIEELADQWAFLVRALGFRPRVAPGPQG